ncbi:hypothetical protein DYB25_001565 [Aphanomyces astaci]|uniref:Prenylcysteine lyase domain-containing protein n=3 Tax=Aphanomyces astaci TaxID=112090 RepID=A0A397B253_APHAT|nr:hypothetical protein DYB36_005098 [Aphanomyces astaci]RHY14229.1 hypothetical protein DYB25_001565 [Aphanomyces astaci]RHY58531.1 hypothetical protein DYB30_005690 [Aphanomyces astaci]RHZ05839.1 hypothetical protein DYB26_002593 [Aphanomyces astaci]RHZ33922.1 hypothetical protein DYB31_003649 [Aphanomyces astaci]
MGIFRRLLKSPLALVVAAVVGAAASVIEPQQRVCIVGGGVGGSATASFLRTLVPDAVEIVVFEQHAILGGRIATFDYHGATIEAGGTVFLTGNEYIMQFTKALNLTLRIPGDTLSSPPQMGIFNGREIVFETSPISWWNTAKLMWRYGPTSLRAFRGVVNDLLTRFRRVYDLQAAGHAFADPADLLRAMGTFDIRIYNPNVQVDLYHLTTVTLESKLAEAGVSRLLINELLAGITRVNYGQNTTMTALAGAVGLAGSGDDLRAVQGGNPLMIQGLLQQAQAIVHVNTKVNAIHTTPLQVDTSSGSFSCDAVVVATPLELSDVQLPLTVPKRPFQTTHATFVEGELRPAKFGLASVVSAGMILTMEDASIPFSSMGLQFQRLDAHKNNQTVSLFKVFSRSRWTDNDVNDWFLDGANVIKRFPWRAYPTYVAPETIPKFKLADGVYYVNAIESAASAMEMSAVGARNVALLVAKQLKEGATSSELVYEATRDAKAATDEL